MQSVMNKGWRFVPLACAALMLLVISVVDPVVAGAPLWQIDEEGFGVALAIPLIPWLACTALAVAIGFSTKSRTVIALLSLLSLSSGIIPAFVWTLLLGDVVPSSSSLWISMGISAVAMAALLALLLGLAGRNLLRGALGRGAD
ncbi:hypothetical protein ACFY5D_01370 [Paeniglutamicibacter sp. NPDC012692]|uniref:hypothetical protein n=1 Tax=Paeniglutamicibacter sp. NPDC012692 TaxID=3364388 RepID=UPI003698F531